MMEHLPKINIASGVLIVICFFLPWFSIDCGNMAIVKVSGYDLASGKISLDENLLRQVSAQYGKGEEDYSEIENQRNARPQFYLVIVVLCALGIIGYSAKMLNEIGRAHV